MITQQLPPHASSISGFTEESYEDDSVNQAPYTAEFIAAVKEGMVAIDRGEFVSFEEFKKEFCSCVGE